MHNLIKSVKLTRVKNAVAAGQTEIDGDILDMAGFDGVLFVGLFGAVTDAADLTLKAQANTANSTGGMADITGAATEVASTATNGNQVLWVDVFRPQKRYVRGVITRTGQNVALDGLLAIQYRANKLPTVQDVTTILQGALAAF